MNRRGARLAEKQPDVLYAHASYQQRL